MAGIKKDQDIIAKSLVSDRNVSA